MNPQSRLIEDARHDYLEDLRQSGHEITEGDQTAAIFLASWLVNDLYGNSSESKLRATVNALLEWADEFQPESKAFLEEKFNDDRRARFISRLVSSSTQPKGSHEPQELLDGLRTNKVRINWK